MKAIAVMGTLILATAAPTLSTAQDNRAAYDVAVRCFIANGSAVSVERRAGNAAAASRYEASARVSFDALVMLGTALGKSRTQMEADIQASQDRDLPRMVSDSAYYRSVISTCRAYGLMAPA